MGGGVSVLMRWLFKIGKRSCFVGVGKVVIHSDKIKLIKRGGKRIKSCPMLGSFIHVYNLRVHPIWSFIYNN